MIDVQALTQEVLDQFAQDYQLSGETMDRLLQYVASGEAAQTLGYTHKPISVADFLDSQDFFGGVRETLYPEIRRAIIEINSGQYSEAVLTGGIGTGKALDTGTPILTRGGWKTMGEVRDGDQVFDNYGYPCHVVKAHRAMYGRDCYRLHFSGGDSIVADGEHLWRVFLNPEDSMPAVVRSTLELMAMGQRQPLYLERLEMGQKRPRQQGMQTITDIYPVATRPVRCLTVDSPNRLYLAGRGLVPTHNTTIALYTQAYQLYLLSCYESPQLAFNLDPSSEILFIFQNLNERLAKAVDYSRFRSMVEQCPYFKDHFPFDKSIDSKLVFPKNVGVWPVSGQQTAAIGLNVYGGLVDEVNFMERTTNSAKSTDGGEYDQAKALYDTLSRRRKSRFLNRGTVPGVFCLSSSKHYPGEFTDKRMAVARRDIERTGKTTIYVYDKVTWEVLPENRFSGQWFHIFIGDDARNPRILEDGEQWPEPELVRRIPEEYRNEFTDDITGALRDIAGVSTLARYPFLLNREAVTGCFHADIANLSSQGTVDFVAKAPALVRGRVRHPNELRLAHIDLGLTGDHAGVVVGHVDRFDSVKRGTQIEVLPHICIDMVLEVQPPRGGEILFHKIRGVLYEITERLHIPLKWVSLDSFQSADSIQQLRQRGYVSGVLSMDRSMDPYLVTKAALYDGRIEIPEHATLKRELLSLERDPVTGKVDHPEWSSKDVADALAGVVYGLTMRRELWVRHHVAHRIPSYLAHPVDKAEQREERDEQRRKVAKHSR